MDVVSWATLIQGAACLTIIVVAAGRADRRGLDSLIAYGAALTGLVGAFLGSHLQVVFMDWGRLATDPWRLADVFATSKAAFGAFVGAAAGGAAFLAVLGRSVRRYADSSAPAVALGYALYRIGCLMHGCEVGTETTMPWAVIGPEGGLTHPVAAYHAMLGVGLYLWLRSLSGGNGRVVVGAFAGYGLGRFGLEFFRVEPVTWLGMNPGHWLSLSLILMVALALGWARLRRRADGTSRASFSSIPVDA